MKKLIYLLLIVFGSVAGQDISIEQCFDLAVKNHPLYSKSSSIDEMHNLKKENLQTNWYPQLSMNAQATYQDPIISIDLPIPIDFPSPSPDQYKTWIDVKQNIYDGGVTKTLKEIEEQSKTADLLEQEVNIDKVKFVVSELYFNILILDHQIKQLELTNAELNDKLDVTSSLVNQGVILQSNYDGLKGEVLKMNQQLIAVRFKRQSLMKVLLKYIDSQEDSLHLIQPLVIPDEKYNINRKEYQLFKANQDKISLYQNLQKKQNYPKFYGFSQVGYGNPGLNMLNDSFEPYYIIGAGISWNITDWNKTKRNIREKQLMINDIELMKNNFNLEVNTAIEKTMSEINSYKELIDSDKEIIELYKNIASTASSQFDNGTINSAEYLGELNKEKQAVLASEIHKLRYMQSIVNLKLLTGEL